jgi:hypothetical protein
MAQTQLLTQCVTNWKCISSIFRGIGRREEGMGNREEGTGKREEVR